MLIENVHFIRGHAADDSTLNKANVTEADTVILTADQQKNESEADMLSVLTLLAIKGLHPSVYCIVEILTERYVKTPSAQELIRFCAHHGCRAG